jgi:hypothetical protein
LDVVNGYSLDNIGFDLPEEAEGTSCGDGVKGGLNQTARRAIGGRGSISADGAASDARAHESLIWSAGFAP